ncbi:MAG TPA: hypothetical protein PK668_25535 [Myxococcota bacterium]|nr:hypothetical protein [Myxococcota bacterium]HRY96891.1 hypothetical protein [Myxococcota bacterium]
MRFWIVTPHGRLAPLMGELRPSRESADRLLALGLTDQRRPLYEVLEVELLRAETLESSTHKNEETKAPDMGDWPPSGVGTENSRTEGTSLLEGEGRTDAELQEATADQLLGGTRQGGRAGQGPEDVDRTLEQTNRQERASFKGHGEEGVRQTTATEEPVPVLLDPVDGGLPPGALQTTTGLRDAFEPQACRGGGELREGADEQEASADQSRVLDIRAGPEGNTPPAAQQEQPTPT